MIHSLCNLVDESNLDTFYKATIIEASQLPFFDHLTPKQEVLEIINSLPASFQAMVIPFLREKLNLSSGTVFNKENKGYQHRISFPLVPQDEAIQQLLEIYNNKLVVVFLSRISHSYLYGTQAQPMLFTYNELHATGKTAIKGYTLEQEGITYGPGFYFAGKESDFPVINRGLAFQLAGSL